MVSEYHRGTGILPDQFFPHIEPGGAGAAFEAGAGRERQADQPEFDGAISGEPLRRLRFGGGFRAAQSVVEVDGGQPVVKDFPETAGNQQRGGAVGAAGKADEQTAVLKRGKKFAAIVKFHL